MSPEHFEGLYCKWVWAAVLQTAIEDAQLRFERHDYGDRLRTQLQEDARRWLAADDRGVGSFIWCCEQLDLDPGQVREVVNTRGTRRENPKDVNRYRGHRPLANIDGVEYMQAADIGLPLHLPRMAVA